MIPLQSIRPRKLKAGAKGPHVVAMTMVGRWDIRLPAWIEYNLMRGAEEIYIYDNVSPHSSKLISATRRV